MTKIALLIGVSDYGFGFNPLPRAQRDVQAMRQILQHPELGSFTEVRTLINPDRQVIEEAIEALFAGRQRDNLVFLYFSGHAIRDGNGKLYLTTTISRKNEREQLVKSSAVPASFVHEAMNESRSRQQVMVLDCCFSEAWTTGVPAANANTKNIRIGVSADTDIKGNSAAETVLSKEIEFSRELAALEKIAVSERVAFSRNTGWLDRDDDSSVDINHQLGGEGRVILTSSASTLSSFEHKTSGLSVYTHYFVEGMETGVADLDSDGAISIEELHEYASKKARTATPVMQPRIYRVENYHQIILAQAPFNDPKRRYRKEVERYVNRGEISVVNRSILNVLRDSLGLLPEEATAIEAGVLEPYHEYQKKLQRYVRGFVGAIHHDSPISYDTRNGLRSFQQILGLTNADVAPIEAQVAQQRESFPSPDQLELTKTQSNPTLNHEAVKPIEPLHEAIAASTAPPPLTKVTTNLWYKNAHPTSVTAPRNFWLLIAIGIAAVLAWVGVIHRFSSRPTAPPASLLKPISVPVPEPLSSPTPMPQTTLVPSPSASVPVPTSTPNPFLEPKPSSSVSEPSVTSVPKPPQSEPTPASPRPTPAVTSVPKPSQSKPKAPSKPTTPAAPRPTLALPDPPKSSPEPPPISAPETTSSSPEPPPNSWLEPPPTSAPGQDY